MNPDRPHQHTAQPTYGATSQETSSTPEPAAEIKTWTERLTNRIRRFFVFEITCFILFVLLIHKSFQTSAQNKETYELISNLRNEIESLEEQLRSCNGRTKIKMPTLPLTTVPLTDNQSNMTNYAGLINAASYLMGARVGHRSKWDTYQYVLMDRPNPPASRDWCTEEKVPVVTIELAKYIQPLYVSYQHSNWNRYVTFGAPRKYDVVACYDDNCDFWKPLVSNCLYDSNGEPEQKCIIPLNSNLKPTKFVQFRFHETHGNTEETCISLLRIYGIPKEKEKNPGELKESQRVCEDLTWAYKNYPILYTMKDKNCTYLYWNECCDECPECCNECVLNDLTFSKFILWAIVFIGVTISILFTCFCSCICLLCMVGKRKRNREQEPEQEQENPNLNDSPQDP